MKRINISLKFYKKSIKVFLNENLFFSQNFMKSNNKFLNNKVYTLFYVYKILYRFGLKSQIFKKFGY